MENKLQHYGILGMRWGVRRSKAQLRRARGPDKPRKVTKEQYEAEKQKAIRSGDKSTVERWKDHLTNDELRKAIDRVDLNRRLNGVNKSVMESGFEKVESVMDKVGRTVNIVNTGLNAYGLVAKINNTFNDKELPTIDGTNIKKKREDAEAKKADEAETKRRKDEAYADKVKQREKAQRAEEETAAQKKADQEKATSRAAQKATIKKLIEDGKTSVLTNNYDTFDQDIIDEVIKELEKKKKHTDSNYTNYS